MGLIQKRRGDVLHISLVYILKPGSRSMQLKKLSRKQKGYLLILGLLVILFLILSGKLFQKDGQLTDKTPVANEELLILGTSDSIEGLGNTEVYTDQGVYSFEKEIDWTPYFFQSVQAVTEDHKILHINNLLQREVKLENCLITENTADTLTIFSEGFSVDLPCKNLTASFSDEIADIYLTNGSITRISTKRESISGKILSVRADGIEMEGYGIVPVAEKFRFYETYGAYREKSAYGLIVGYEQARMIVAEGKICAAILDTPMNLEKIRVLLKTTDFADLVHSNVNLKAHGTYELVCGDETKILNDGEELKLNAASTLFKDERIILTPQSESARMEICSVERNYGTPVYAGRIEVVKDSGGLMIINELDLETYLYSVVPSEMPASYEMEALKAQAVCARSYAYRQILLNAYANYGAHVDDSVSYQVYNNLTTDEKVIRAVNETAGQVLKFGDEVATTYYFSTSCGYTTNETIWKNGLEENSYISGKLLNDSMEKLSLREEAAFREFILNETHETYDRGESWYRWDMTVPVEQITETIRGMKDIGEVQNIEITERNEGGVVQKALLTGEKGELEIIYEHAIRVALNGKGQTIKRTHGKDATGGEMLPSGFFVVDKIEENGKVSAFRFRGGGFGHGAGMSQNGANHMAETGKTYEEILGLFYEGTTLSQIE